MIIGICGVARSGKDTTYNLFNKALLKRNKTSERFAFADQIKYELKPLLEENFNINPFDCDDDTKEKIRPLMVAYGTHLARALDENHWIKRLSQRIKSKSIADYQFITDVRYENEINFLRSNFDKSYIIYVEREGFKPINEEEEINCPKLRSRSDYVINWPSFNEAESEGYPYVEKIINEELKDRQ